MPLTQLVYTSRRSNDLTFDVLESLVEHSAAANKSRDITGVLLCHGRNIMQLLEGDPADLDPVFHRIQANPLHADVRTLLSKPVDRCLFPEWGMGLAILNNKSAVSPDRLARLVSDVRTHHDTAAFAVEARILLHDFRQQVATAI